MKAGRANLPKLALALLLAGAVAWGMANREHVDIVLIKSRILDFGIWAEFAFVVIYALATVFFVPGSIFGLAGGALFGAAWGTIWSLAGATVGATLAFVCSRYLASDWAERVAGGKIRRLKDGVEAEGWRFVAFVRLVPLFPFNLVNYAFGLTRIPLTQYVITSAVCMFPGALAYSYLGYAGREVVGGGEDLLQKSLIGLALLATVLFLPRFVTRLRRMPMRKIAENMLKQWLDSGEATVILDVRSASEYDGELGHITGSRNIPLADLPAALHRIELPREECIVVVCRTDKRSAQAARLLANAGYSKVNILEGGMEQWNRMGFPVARQQFS